MPWEQARDLSGLIGLKPQHLATFRAARLALHHVLIRVTAEVHVPDGPNYADLGINLRGMVRDILRARIAPAMAGIQADFDKMRAETAAIVSAELDAALAPPPAPPPPGLWTRLFSREPATTAPPGRDALALAAVQAWAGPDGPGAGATHRAACLRALARTVGAVLAHRGGLLAPPDVIVSVATNLVSNDWGSQLVGARIAPLFDQAVEDLGLYRLKAQTEPLVLNAKGASASGKSSIRGQQQRIAKNLGIGWRDFAIISPDYWRKYLIDYDSLGEDHKYAAMLTGQELEVVDRKLDTLMAEKAAAGTVPHMLIDRFRFDSFRTDTSGAEDSTLLTRFGSKVYMFFLVTPPRETVVRAWQRGLETGRFKAVDDLLYHNIEAYAGMPDLFLAWAQNKDRWVHYEFLDNDVPLGQPPRTLAFGANGTLIIRDLARFCDIERFRHVNVDARGPDQVQSRTLTPDQALAIVRRVCAALTRVEFLVPGSDRVFARSTDGALAVWSPDVPDGISLSGLGPHTLADAPLGQIDPGARADLIGA